MELNKIIKDISTKMEGSDAHFFERVWNTDLDKYKNRLLAIDFKDKKNVLDAGFGMGQWMYFLAKQNENVYGLEYANNRLEAVTELFKQIKQTNVSLVQGSVDKLPYEDNFFDAVFCYGVIFVADVKKVLKEFYRVLKPGGKLYFSANGLGWYYNLILEERNKTKQYDPREIAFKVIDDSMYYLSNGAIKPGTIQLAIPSEVTKQFLKQIGFKNIVKEAEGNINITKTTDSISFYENVNFYDHEGIYEILCEK